MDHVQGQQPPSQQPRYRTPPAVIVAIIAALCLIGGLVLQRQGEIEHNRQIDDMVDGFVEESGG